MNNNIETIVTPNNSKTAAGVILLAIGGILLVRQFDLFFIPDWLFSWPMWIIAWGLYMGAKYNFRKPSWIMITLIGAAFLLNENIAGADRVVWPLAVMAFGVWMILKPRNIRTKFILKSLKALFSSIKLPNRKFN